MNVKKIIITCLILCLICGFFFSGHWFLALVVVAGVFLFRHFFCWSPPEGACFLWLGVPGSGKTTLAAWIANYYFTHDPDHRVFSNVPITGTYVFDWKRDFGHYDMSKSIVICDEAGIYLNGRNWKNNFDQSQLEVAKKFRHYEMTLHFFSQSCDEDPVVRNLANQTFVVKKSILPRCIQVRTIRKSIDINDTTHTSQDFECWLPFSRRLIYAPSVWHLFDTHDRVDLPDKIFDKW